jgi:hypothetical protein
MFPKTCLRICRLSERKLLVKCLESPEIFVEIPQKLEVSNRTKPFSIAEETLNTLNVATSFEII